ncbi:SMP-30/gluconolactonase/LRE family protein [Parafrankia sp. EUN1f]|uniref:SMP-30/gluconolactonase/LRE family protein n=1 Tax=Parafrankia sp. EUN1f TaxID=102897 RepID=UPI0001C43AAD|nr:SMP-30/gluconolactonase/LRE family protein [Parafrankia sp. EUN1f]EFC83473.1 SMP-30/Gluconolaconase/LRE domain protein [Parafrankia sp. EUN1f]
MNTTYDLTVLATGGAYFEAPRWRDGRWWVSDLYRKGIYTHTPDGRQEQVVALEHQPSGLGFLPDGSLLYVSQEDQLIYRRSIDGSSTTVHADLSGVCVGDLNDLVVDDRGFAYVGFFGFDPFADQPPVPASVVCVRPDGTFFVAADDLMFPNGSVITENGSELIIGEGMAGCYTAFDIGADGSLSGRRPWAVLSRPGDRSSTTSALLQSLDVILDGCCLDAEGAIWSADVQNCRVIRVAEGGEILDVIPAPEGQNVFACMLGGDDGRTLLMCVAPGLRDNDRLGDLSATLQTTRVAVPRAGRP